MNNVPPVFNMHNYCHICIASCSRDFRGAGGGQSDRVRYSNAKWNKCVFSLDLNTGRESLVITDTGSEFQTDGAECRKARFADSVLVHGLLRSGTVDEHNVHADSQTEISWCCNAVDLVGQHSQSQSCD